MRDHNTALATTSVSVLKKGDVGLETFVFLLLLVLSAVVFWSDLRALVALSLSRDEYSHILLIPFVTAFLIYRNRQEIFVSREFNARAGLPLVISGIGLHILALVVGSHSLLIAVAAVLLFVLGSFTACYGREAFRVALFPLLFLGFMLPLPNATMDQAIFFLQRQSTALSEVLYRIIGIPVLRQGFTFVLPGVTIEVARECSGIHSSVALLLTTVLAAHLFLRSNWRRGLLCLAVVPIAILKNGVRIVTLSTLAAYVNPIFLTGPIHHQGGFIFFGMGVGSIGLLLVLLRSTENANSPIRAFR